MNFITYLEDCFPCAYQNRADAFESACTIVELCVEFNATEADAMEALAIIIERLCRQITAGYYEGQILTEHLALRLYLVSLHDEYELQHTFDY